MFSCRFCSELFSLPRNGSELHSESMLLFFPRNEIPSCFLFRAMVWNRILRVASIFVPLNINLSRFSSAEGIGGIPRVCFYFCSTEQNSELFSLHRKCSEHKFQEFSVLGNSRNSVENNHLFLYSIFCGIIFCRKFTTLAWPSYSYVNMQCICC
jgi:hypothetical protein